MCVIAKAFSEDKAIKTAFTQLQGEIYNEASNGKFYLITKSLLNLNNEQLRVVIDKLKSLDYDFVFLDSNPNPHLTTTKAHKITWGLK